MIDQNLINILCCPKCKQKIQFDNTRILCNNCNLQFPIKNDIPVMLISEAKKIEE